jgi:hypothetical protein
MKDCWAYAPRQRPKFAKLVQSWADLKTPEGSRLLSQATRAYPEMPVDEEEVEYPTNVRKYQNESIIANPMPQLNYADISVQC